MKEKTLIILLALVMVLGGALVGISSACSAPTKGVSDIYPYLKPMAEIIGEENLSVMHLVGVKAANKAMKDLPFNRGDANILLMTDAGHIAKIGEYPTDNALDGVTMRSGNFVGTGNRVIVHKDYKSPLWFAFFDKKSGNCIYLQANSEIVKGYMDREKEGDHHASEDFMKLRDEEIFAKTSKENIAAERLYSIKEEWQKKMRAEVFGGPYGPGNELSILTIANMWAKGVPNDHLKGVELHNHNCPGVTIGYMISQYVKKNLPSDKPEREYTFIAVPPGCWVDNLQTQFQSTAGAKHMYSAWLTKEQKKAQPPEHQRDVTIVIRKKIGEKHADGLALGFDRNKQYKGAGTSQAMYTPKAMKSSAWWVSRLKDSLYLADYMDKPEEFVFVIKKFTLDGPQFDKIKATGVNPLAELGIMPKVY